MEETEQISVSPETLARMKAELEDLRGRGRAEMSERLQTAREHGDLKENAEYDAAKNDQGLMEARIRKLEHIIRNAVVLQEASGDVAGPGAVVKVQEEGEEDPEEYYLAASAEDRIEGARTVTTSSPLGKAIVGKKVGDAATVEAPAGSFKVEIIEIRPA